MPIISNHDELCRAVFLCINERVKDDYYIKRVRRAFCVYWSALERAPSYGLIGVGAISFAEKRLTKFCRIVKLEKVQS